MQQPMYVVRTYVGGETQPKCTYEAFSFMEAVIALTILDTLLDPDVTSIRSGTTHWVVTGNLVIVRRRDLRLP